MSIDKESGILLVVYESLHLHPLPLHWDLPNQSEKMTIPL